MKAFNLSILVALTVIACQEAAPTITHPPQEPDQAFEAVLRGLEKDGDAQVPQHLYRPDDQI